MKFLNWLLYEVHRWLGIALAVFMFAWFSTGIAIMYSTPTTQSRSQQLAHAETLAPQAGWLSLGVAWERSAAQRKASAAERRVKPSGNAEAAVKQSAIPPAIADARLLRIAGAPVWLVEDTQGMRFALSANDGSLREASADQALRIAGDWFKAENAAPVALRYLESAEKPIILRNQDTLRPFHNIATEDGRELLISARTGEVLHASTRLERALYWSGNWLHLLKPLEAVGLGEYRHTLQLGLGLFATVASLTGLIIGWLRWRPGFGGKPTYSQGRTQPYREFWAKWHFWSGLLGGTAALCWAFSGFLDTNPGKWFTEENYSKEELNRFLGSELPPAMRDWRPTSSIAAAADGEDIVGLNWRRLGAEAVLLAETRDGRRLPLTGNGAGFGEAAIRTAVQRLAGEVPVASVETLRDYDSYYYPRHHQGLKEKPLPVHLAKLADDSGTLIYLDPQDGRLIGKFDRSRRVFRWLYSALHHWDFGWLYYRPIWDFWMLAWISFGLVLGASSLVIGWRRLKKSFAPKKQAVPRTTVQAAKLKAENAV
ncbi:PepSY domain-containing protein [Methylomicrobium sp. RS1]|uniref:PepSY domain-containing protein n=1 Tax=Candidatus Methylomicrobium oryzae TaxID=2802053 RepID=UPI0019228C8E|nr:PepSY domain-containing protein [Methylomicrobium sp. RS1]MBL1265917.1 PepSY domain-containing protein [Methylomicrobium sp. RS1]